MSWLPITSGVALVQRAALIAVAAASVGCFPKTAVAPVSLSQGAMTSASARWPGATAASLSTGQNLFTAKCNGCHGYPDVTAIPDDRWPRIIERMGKKAQLGDAERDAVLHYVLASRSEQLGR